MSNPASEYPVPGLLAQIIGYTQLGILALVVSRALMWFGCDLSTAVVCYFSLMCGFLSVPQVRMGVSAKFKLYTFTRAIAFLSICRHITNLLNYSSEESTSILVLIFEISFGLFVLIKVHILFKEAQAARIMANQ